MRLRRRFQDVLCPCRGRGVEVEVLQCGCVVHERHHLRPDGVEDEGGNLIVTDLRRVDLVVPENFPVKCTHIVHGHELGEITEKGVVAVLRSPASQLVVHLLSRSVARPVQRRTLRYGDHDGLHARLMRHLMQHNDLMGHVHLLHAVQLIEIVGPTEDDDERDP